VFGLLRNTKMKNVSVSFYYDDYSRPVSVQLDPQGHEIPEELYLEYEVLRAKLEEAKAPFEKKLAEISNLVYENLKNIRRV
jgi:hypothetical protein